MAASTKDSPSLPDSQVLMVTGKGGVGKSAIAAGLATACAQAGRQTLLTVYEREDCNHPLLDAQVEYEPVEYQPGLWLSRLDSRLSMKEYIHRNIPFHLLYDWLLSGKMLGQFTDAAPGFDELMCLGKLYDLADGSDGKQPFDTIIFDAPATGHSSLMLRTPAVTAETVRSGPIHQSALKVQAMLEDAERFSVLVVALAEEMAIQEGCELTDYVGDELQLSVGPMLVNRTRSPRFSDTETAALQGHASTVSTEAQAAIGSAVAHHELCKLQQGYIERLRAERKPWLEVPRVIQARFDAQAIVAGIAECLAPTMEGLA